MEKQRNPKKKIKNNLEITKSQFTFVPMNDEQIITQAQPTAEAQDVSIKDMKSLVKELRKFDTNWAQSVMIRMNKHALPILANVNTVYNIVNGTKKSDLYKNVFVICANELMQEYKAKKEKAGEVIKSISEGEGKL